jgi:Dual specificity phosphatase, catalytic domain
MAQEFSMPISSQKAYCIGFSLLLITIPTSIWSADPNKAQSWGEWMKDQKNLALSAAAFIPTIHWNDYFGQGPCTFHSMLEPFDPQKKEPYIIFNADDSISAIYDANEVLLNLGNMPRSENHFKQLRKMYGLPEDALIGMHTLNRFFERKYVWLKTSIEKDGNVRQYKYSTIDFTPPSQIDLIRAVYNIDARHREKEDVVLVHCKAGKGRSGTVVIAYYIHVYHGAQKMYVDGTPYTKQLSNAQVIDALIKYGQLKRPLVKINDNQKPALFTFYAELQKSGDLKTLYAQNQQEIHQRELALNRGQQKHARGPSNTIISNNHNLLPVTAESPLAQTGEDSLQKMIEEFEKREPKDS